MNAVIIMSAKKFAALLFISLIFVGGVSAQVSMLGVSPGDSFTYDF